MKGHLKVVKLLVEHDAVINTVDTNARLPLHYSCKNGHKEVSLFLIQTGSNVNERDREYATPLHMVCKYGNIELISSLMNYGADIQATMTNGESSLHIACQHNQDQVVECLLENNANRNVKDNDRFMPMHRASEAGSVECLKILLNQPGVDVNLKGKDQTSALTLACRTGHLQVVKLLVQHRAIIDIYDLGKRTPLHWAMCYGYLSVASCLLQNGSDPFILDKNGQYPLQLAIACSKVSDHQRISLLEYDEEKYISLMKLCRKIIRRQIHGNLKEKLGSIHLPTRLKEYLCYSDIPLHNIT